VKANIEANKGLKCDYEMIFMDCSMPIMDGYKATNKIRETIEAAGLLQPIISAVTGHSEESMINLAIQSGMNQVLSKPIKAEVIDNLLR